MRISLAMSVLLAGSFATTILSSAAALEPGRASGEMACADFMQSMAEAKRHPPATAAYWQPVWDYLNFAAGFQLGFIFSGAQSGGLPSARLHDILERLETYCRYEPTTPVFHALYQIAENGRATSK